MILFGTKLSSERYKYVSRRRRKIPPKFQNEVGGRVRYMITASAPLNGEVLEMCRIALGAHIVEGYGQTEATAMSTITFPGEYIGGHCGGPSVCATIKLADVPELSYYSVICQLYI